MSYGLNGDSKQIISGLKSERDRLKERVAVLEMLVQSTSDDRDGYMEHVAERTEERDLARRIAVELEQQLANFELRLSELTATYRGQLQSTPSLYNAGAADVLGIVEDVFMIATGPEGLAFPEGTRP